MRACECRRRQQGNASWGSPGECEAEMTPRSQIAIGSIVVRCRRFDEMLAFWQAALGYAPREPPEDGWVVLADPTGIGPNISLDRVDQPPPLGKVSRVHLDLYTDDGEREVERLLGLGATRYEHEGGPDDDFVVLIDPDGNRFCVVSKPYHPERRRSLQKQ